MNISITHATLRHAVYFVISVHGNSIARFICGTSATITVLVYQFARTLKVQFLYIHYIFCDTPLCLFYAHLKILPLTLERLSNLSINKNLINTSARGCGRVLTQLSHNQNGTILLSRLFKLLTVCFISCI
jgi:hypothetical protein